MPNYLYEAYSKDNKIIHGEYEASSRGEIMEYLTRHDLTPVSIKAVHELNDKKNALSVELFESISPVDMMFLVRNLSTTVKAGLSIVESLDILIKDTENKLMQKILTTVKSSVENGQSLSSGFEVYKNLFPPIFIGMIKAGEVSGRLDQTLAELAQYISKEYVLKSKVKSALTYPIILLVSSAVIVFLMMIFVLPKLAISFAQSGVKLPLVTTIFLSISKIITWNYFVDLIVVAGIVFLIIYFKSTKTGKNCISYVISHTPVANDLVKKIALVRFSRTFGNLIGSGLSVVNSLEISAQSINNQNYTIVINKTIEDIENGISVSTALSKYPDLFPRLLISLITVGERTGTLQEILLTFSDFYDEEVDNKLKDLTSLLEPALLLIMGLMIGAIAISIILPIYQLVGHFV